jgi:hypothetical protein
MRTLRGGSLRTGQLPSRQSPLGWRRICGLTQIGTACAGLAVVTAGRCSPHWFPSFRAGGRGSVPVGPIGALVSAGLMLIICVVQVLVWRRAMASWSGRAAS